MTMAKAQILVVEDDNIVVMELRDRLQSLGYVVAAVASYGEEALEKAAETRPDLVLMDIRLRGAMDGLEAAEQIRARFNIPVVYLTAYADETTLQQAKVTEPFGYIIKPFEERELRTNIEIALYKHELEKKLEESEQWLATTLRSIGDAVIATDKEGLVTFVNPVAEALTGWEQEDALGRDVTEVFHIVSEETRTVGESLVAKAIEKGAVVSVANQILIDKDGTEIAVDDSVSPIRDEKGNVSGAVLVFRDITKRKRAEEELRESEEKYKTLVEDAPIGIYYSDFNGTFLYGNKKAEEIVGYKRGELIGKNYLKLKLLDAKEMGKAIKLLARNRLGRATGPDEFTLNRKDGSKRIVEIRTRAITIGGKQVVLGMVEDITERKRTEGALWESEERYRLHFENVTDVVYSIDPEFRVLSVSPSVERLLGYKPEELIGRSFQELNVLASDSLEIALSDMMRVLSGEQVASSVYEFIAKDRTRRFGEVSGAPLVRDGKVVAVVSVARDITQRRRVEEALKASQDYTRNIIDSSLDMIIAVDMDRHIVEFNKAAEQTFGYRREEVLGVHVDILYADPQEGLRVHQTAIEKGRCVREIHDRRKNGEVFPCFLSASVLRDARGELVGVMGVSRDITERKRAEEALRRAHDELERRVGELTFLNRVGRAMASSLDLEQVLTTVMEETALVLGTEAGSISLLDEESGELVFEAAVGSQSEEVKGLKIPVGQGIAGWVVQEGQRLLVPAVREDPRFYSGIDEATGFVTRSVLAVPLKVKGKVIGVIEAVNKIEGDFGQADVALLSSMAQPAAIAIENARLFKDLQDRMEELERTQAQLLQVQKMESIGQLAAGIAHDFNNLLTPISGFAELLLLKAPEGSQQQEYLHQIKTATERAAALTRQLRLFTRQAEGERHPLQLNNVVKETRGLLERSIPKEIAIELHLASELWVVEADLSQISQVLMNLCLNARDAMSYGGTLTLETCNLTLDEEWAQAILEAQPGRYVCLSVSDTGCGMSSEVQARLFEPFFTTKEVGRGTGLGLAVVYGIVKGHGGFIQVYSEVGRGSTFRVYLPAIESVVGEREVEGWELPTGTETILLVDDEQAVQALGQRVLELCGYTVLMAENGDQALEVYQAHQGEIALVVLDVIMPEMGGQECLRRLRELDPQVKVLISTGYTANSTAQKLVTEGALGVVEKPFRLQDFAAAVRAALDQS